MTAEAIKELFAGRGVKAEQVRTRALSYVRPTAHWLVKVAPTAWSKEMRRLGIQYYDGSFVCRHIALQCCLSMMRWHAGSNAATAEPLAVGTLGYLPDTATVDGHECLVGITETGIIVLEPQRATTGLGSCLQEKTLSAAEWQSPLLAADFY